METRELLDREEIRATLSRYNLAGDRGQIDELASCFLEDGVLEVEGGWTARGREEIRRRTGGAARAGQRAALMRHHLTTQGIELEPEDAARAWSYFLVISEIGPDHAGRYVDRLRRVGGNWMIEHRRVVIEWHSNDSAFPALRPAAEMATLGSSRAPTERGRGGER
jgi:ketosteroid isomerase-like protein